MSEMLEKARKYEEEQGKQIKAEDGIRDYRTSLVGSEMCIRDRCLNSSKLGYNRCEKIIMECSCNP